MIGSRDAATQPPDLLSAADLYAATFTGRPDVYSFWAPESIDGDGKVVGPHWKVARRLGPEGFERLPLTGARVLAAFQSGIPLSTYLLTPDSYTYVAALDIDRDNGLESGWLFAKHLRGLGGVCYVEPSRRGCHLWIVMDDKRPAVLVRRALKGLIKEAGLPPCPGEGQDWIPNAQGRPVCPGCGRAKGGEHGKVPRHDDPKIELRPGSDRLNGPDSLGHCIRMPTMPHQTTGKRHRLYSSDGEPISGKLTEMMLAIEECPVAVIDDAAERAPLPQIAGSPLDLRFPFGAPETSDSVCDILENLWGVVPRPRPGSAVICPAHDDHKPSLSIPRDDQRAFCKNGGCILNNNGRGRGTDELVRLAPRRGGG